MRLMGNSAPRLTTIFLTLPILTPARRGEISTGRSVAVSILPSTTGSTVFLSSLVYPMWMLVLMSPPLSAMDSDRFSAGSIKTGRRVFSTKSIMTTLPESFIKGSATGTCGTEETGKTPTIFPSASTAAYSPSPPSTSSCQTLPSVPPRWNSARPQASVLIKVPNPQIISPRRSIAASF